MMPSRRRTLQIVGSSIAGSLLAGCLSTDDPRDNGASDPGENGSSGDHPDGDGDDDDLSIDGRLNNESGARQTFGVVIREVNGSEIASAEWEVNAGETVSAPGFGRPGEPRTFEVTVARATKTETLDFDVEATPGMRDGYVEITYTQEGTVEIQFTPHSGDRIGDEAARIEEPLYEISEPACGPEGERNPLWLCENMASEPSLPFDQVETTAAVFADEGLGFDTEMADDPQFYAVLLTDDADFARLDAQTGGDVAALIEGIDLDTEAAVVVQTGWGSGSETPHLKRIEETDNGIHAFGCYRRPCGGSADHTMRTVVARFRRPETLSEGVVSLTVNPQIQVNVATGEGVVTVGGI